MMRPQPTDKLASPPSTGRKRRPPAPPGLPLLGHLRQLQRDPLRFFLTATHRYGDVVYYHLPGSGPRYLVNHPDLIGQVLVERAGNYVKGVRQQDLLHSVFGDGLLTADGDHWLRQRRLIQPAFHRRQVAAFGTLMTREAVSLLHAWATDEKTGGTVDLAVEMRRLTLNILCATLFGQAEAQGEQVHQAFAVVARSLVEVAQHPLSFLPWLPTPRLRRFGQAVRALEQVVYRLIERARLQPAQAGPLLSRLVAAGDPSAGATSLDDRAIRDEVLTMLIAGHETTALALTWTWYLLSLHPEAEQQLHAELDTVLAGRLPIVDDLPLLPYTRMVIDEALRLYPPVWLFARVAERADELGGYALPPQTVVQICPYALHRHPGLWERPEAFDPERFRPERRPARAHFAYLPFGGGARQCIGNGFALMEAQLVLATLAQRARFRLLPGTRGEPEPLLTLAPRNGLPMRRQAR